MNGTNRGPGKRPGPEGKYVSWSCNSQSNGVGPTTGVTTPKVNAVLRRIGSDTRGQVQLVANVAVVSEKKMPVFGACVMMAVRLPSGVVACASKVGTKAVIKLLGSRLR